MCGIFGIEGNDEAANLTYHGLYALQHRGQESGGIVSWDGLRLQVERGMGHVREIFSGEALQHLPGYRAIGHTRYSTAGASVITNAQPVVVKTALGPLAIVHNGNLVDALDLRHRLEQEGAIFQTTSDSEVILHLMARSRHGDVTNALIDALRQVRGAYSLLLATEDRLIAARDPHGFRPLVFGWLGPAPCFASESCAFDLLGAVPERELEPGEVLVARGSEIESRRLAEPAEPRRCIFEHVYFARPDSRIFGEAVSAVRLRMGAQLAREAPADADIVVPVPDSGLFAALGYSRESGLPFELGLIRNHYVGRTFIQPSQEIRDFGVRVKLNTIRELLAGRKVILVDDSIVRGTTSRKIVQLVREAGAVEVHVRIPSPPTAWPCHYGIDTPTRGELIASHLSVAEIADFIGADSLAYLSLEGLLASAAGLPDSYCTACWTGRYPVPAHGDPRQVELFPIRTEGER
ncbi:MAG TPA: amidophosphoribosyltransferase [Thermoanaerobaculia bacterium]|nr:amidophosphoribosyltransferase [Thermoanaerobaculia bacterium]